MTTYYVSDQYAKRMLLRRTGSADEIFARGHWQPTDEIRQHLVGDNDFLDTVSETQARQIAPAAFRLAGSDKTADGQGSGP